MKKIVAVLLLTVLGSTAAECSVSEQEYMILYPLETTKQAVHAYDGSRFTETGEKVTVALGVLNNPLVNNTYADVALFASNGSGEPLEFSVISARTRAGELEILPPDTLRDRIMTNDIFMEKISAEELAPKAQAYGCSPNKGKDTLKPEEISKLQQQVVDFQSNYKLKLPQYLRQHLFTTGSIVPGSIGGGMMRIILPSVKDDGPMLLKLQAGDQKLTLRLQLQRLN